jgi:hypothetical protein
MPIIPSHGKLKQEDHAFEDSWGYITRPCVNHKDSNNCQSLAGFHPSGSVLIMVGGACISSGMHSHPKQHDCIFFFFF